MNSEAYAKEFDFKAYEPLAIFEFAFALSKDGTNRIYLAQITNESFFTQFVAYAIEF